MLTASPRTPSVKENQRKLEWKETAILSDLQLKYATFANSTKTFGHIIRASPTVLERAPGEWLGV